MNCIAHEGCVCENHCNYAGACLVKIIRLKTPKSRWGRLINRLKRLTDTGKCDLSQPCKSCYSQKCTFRKLLDEIINFVPKQPLYEYYHPVYGRITSLIDPNGSGKENRKKRRVLMKYGCCQQCNSKERLTVDHIQERSKGGSADGTYNLTILCQDCNQRKSDPRYKYYTLSLPKTNTS